MSLNVTFYNIVIINESHCCLRFKFLLKMKTKEQQLMFLNYP